jgi:hypothetical protein
MHVKPRYCLRGGVHCRKMISTVCRTRTWRVTLLTGSEIWMADSEIRSWDDVNVRSSRITFTGSCSLIWQNSEYHQLCFTSYSALPVLVFVHWPYEHENRCFNETGSCYVGPNVCHSLWLHSYKTLLGFTRHHLQSWKKAVGYKSWRK